MLDHIADAVPPNATVYYAPIELDIFVEIHHLLLCQPDFMPRSAIPCVKHDIVELAKRSLLAPSS
jgi:hypothetical protein